ncbi:MAG: hypothetical protein LIP12_00185 [Clostridiales bacterium]|nr:hypothetical protein [Clostridiales bacterium]
MATTKKSNTGASTGKKKPGIDQNVWSRFDDDGYGIHNVQRPKATGKEKSTSTAKKKK